MARKRARKAPMGLSRDKIARAALKLIDRHGLDAFSTRKLGGALRCEAMAIYWYYPSKEALLDAVVEQLVAPLALAIEDGDDWVATLRRVAHAYRKIAHDHPRAFPLLATRRFASEGSYAFLDELFALARRHGLADREVARIYRAVSSYCNGFALNELASARELSDPGVAAARAAFPHVERIFALLAPSQADDTFAFGLDLLLAPLTDVRARRRSAS